jgi:hypothetical protein
MDDREAMIDEVIDKFNFERVHITMTALDWKWRPTVNGPQAVPSISKLKERARYLLRESINHKVIGSGGFEATYTPKVDNDPEYFYLKFILCEADSYDD